MARTSRNELELLDEIDEIIESSGTEVSRASASPNHTATPGTDASTGERSPLIRTRRDTLAYRLSSPLIIRLLVLMLMGTAAYGFYLGWPTVVQWWHDVRDPVVIEVPATNPPPTIAPDEPPVIHNISDITVEYGDDFDPLDGILVSDAPDGDLTSNLVVTGDLDTSVAGEHTLVYTVVDSSGNITSATRTVTVTDEPEPEPTEEPKPTTEPTKSPTKSPTPVSPQQPSKPAPTQAPVKPSPSPKPAPAPKPSPSPKPAPSQPQLLSLSMTVKCTAEATVTFSVPAGRTVSPSGPQKVAAGGTITGSTKITASETLSYRASPAGVCSSI